MPKKAEPIKKSHLDQLRRDAESDPTFTAKRADGQQPGLYARARRGAVEFWFRAKAPDRIWYRIGGYGEITLDAARKTAQSLRGLEAETRADDGDLRGVLDALRRKKITAGGVFAAYIQDFEHRVKTGARRGKASSLAEVRRIADRSELNTIRNTPAERLTADQVKAVQKVMKERPGAANKTVDALSAAFNFAKRAGLVSHNPCADVERLKEPGQRRGLTRAELQRLGAAMRETTDNPRLVLAVSFLALTGFRRAELTGAPHNARNDEPLRWRDVDLDTGVVTLRDSKTGPQKRVIGQAAIHLLREWKPRDAKQADFIITGEQSAAYRQFNHQRRRLWKRAGLPIGERGSKDPYTDLHSLRHSFASIGAHLEDGRYSKLVSVLLGHGHQSKAITKRYITEDLELLRAPADAIAGEIARLLGLGEMAKVVPIRARSA